MLIPCYYQFQFGTVPDPELPGHQLLEQYQVLEWDKELKAFIA